MRRAGRDTQGPKAPNAGVWCHSTTRVRPPDSAERIYRQVVETVLAGLAIGGQVRVTG